MSQANFVSRFFLTTAPLLNYTFLGRVRHKFGMCQGSASSKKAFFLQFLFFWPDLLQNTKNSKNASLHLFYHISLLEYHQTVQKWNTINLDSGCFCDSCTVVATYWHNEQPMHRDSLHKFRDMLVTCSSLIVILSSTLNGSIRS